MTTLKIAIATVLLLALAAPAHAGPLPSGLCPAGFDEMFNVNEPGCTFCSAPNDCELNCLGPPQCFCSPGDRSCCEATPCCFNCPEPKPLSCETSTCSCTPESCCFTICPATPAPVNSAAGLAILTTVLVALGMGALRVARRRR